ncbi:hypothetical protein QN379_09830 [Glaciimonas sp. Gout2]|uniref:hypothetical protein n=1 Tax=Glaciimonas sp. Gout2 TaxID=3048625 RepID=UPI002B233AC7|nr:hypothetical protein [Glaciimonas sp. Gout2]MEB0082314.1 hypothetical protein [Glaciimonas sp. Gout2]
MTLVSRKRRPSAVSLSRAWVSRTRAVGQCSVGANIRLTETGFLAELEEVRTLEHADIRELASILFAMGVTADDAHGGDWREGSSYPDERPTDRLKSRFAPAGGAIFWAGG